MKSKYIKQRDKYSCGAVALYNTLVWLGYPVRLSYLSILKEKCKSEPGLGTYLNDFEKVLRQEFKKDLVVLKLRKKVYSRIKKELNKGNAFISLYTIGIISHYALFIKKGKHVIGINDDGKLFSVAKPIELKYITTFRYNTNWLLKKRKIK